MRYYELKAITEYLRDKKMISNILRVGNSVIKITFDQESLYFDMTKGQSKVYKKDEEVRSKIFQAPFDVTLYKRFKKANIEAISMLGEDKVIQIQTRLGSSYKEHFTTLQLEFTGRNTNAILLDESGIVLDALRHIDSATSFRQVKRGVKLEPIPALKSSPKQGENITDMNAYLNAIYQKDLEQKLNQLKTIKLLQLHKNLEKINTILENLQKEEDLLNASEQNRNYGDLILANMHTIKPYQKEASLIDFEGKAVSFVLPEFPTINQMADFFYKQARKLKQKAKNIYIEKENLESKRLFIERMERAIEHASSLEEVEILFPKKKQQKSNTIAYQNIERFDIDGFVVRIGKNEKGNIALLKESRANDIWMHLKDRPSAHLIISTNKQNIKPEVLEVCAKICASFSVDEHGNYLVDYAKRRDVKPKERAFVNYVNYKTLQITID
jgi:predicted ribosome quality control (RQC) complex YloA/Tae2 family protein